MTNIGKELYIQSYENILALVEDTLFMEDSFKRYKNTGYEDNYRRIVKSCRQSLSKDIKSHNKKYLDDLKDSKLKDLIKGLGIRNEEALSMIKYIDNLDMDLSDNEMNFVSSIRSSTKSRLSLKQTKWLSDIYVRSYSWKTQNSLRPLLYIMNRLSMRSFVIKIIIA